MQVSLWPRALPIFGCDVWFKPGNASVISIHKLDVTCAPGIFVGVYPHMSMVWYIWTNFATPHLDPRIIQASNIGFRPSFRNLSMADFRLSRVVDLQAAPPVPSVTDVTYEQAVLASPSSSPQGTQGTGGSSALLEWGSPMSPYTRHPHRCSMDHK